MKTAIEFKEWESSLGPRDDWSEKTRDEILANFKLLPATERRIISRQGVEDYFIAENCVSPDPMVHMSPSGRWKLVVTAYGTKKGSWSFSRGEVYNVESGLKVADVKRNYSNFWHFWYENHPVTGDDYLVCGEDYQSHTVCNLQKSTQRSFVPHSVILGYGWCPASASTVDGLTEGSVFLKVEGCYWACPYNIQVWDFTNPDVVDIEESGLPDLTADLFLDLEKNVKLSFEQDNKLVFSKCVRKFKATREWESEVDQKFSELLTKKMDPSEHESFYTRDNNTEDEALWEQIDDHRQVYVLGPSGKYELQEEWKSDRLKVEDAQNEAFQQERKDELNRYKKSDLYLPTLRQRFPDCLLYTVYPSMASVEEGETNAFYFRYNIDNHVWIEWGTDNGPFKLGLKGKDMSNMSYERSQEGFEAALAAVIAG